MKPLLSGLMARPRHSGGSSPKNKIGKALTVDLWCHATEPAHVPAFAQLRRSIALERPDLTCLITTDGSLSIPDSLDE